MHFSSVCTRRTVFFSLFFISCIFCKYKCYKRHIHCNAFACAFLFESTACILSRSGSFYLCRYLDLAQIDAYNDTNELYSKAKWILYCDTGSGLPLDFFCCCCFYSTIHLSSTLTVTVSSCALVFPCPSSCLIFFLHFLSRWANGNGSWSKIKTQDKIFAYFYRNVSLK